jgi:hypothetical protein
MEMLKALKDILSHLSLSLFLSPLLLSSLTSQTYVSLFAPQLLPYTNCSDSNLYQMDTTQECSRLNNTTPQCGLPPLNWEGVCQEFNPALGPATGRMFLILCKFIYEFYLCIILATCEPFTSKMVSALHSPFSVCPFSSFLP